MGAERQLALLPPHYGAECPAAVVAMASRLDEMVLRGTLAGIAGQGAKRRLRRTAVIIVGRTPAAENCPDSHLCPPERDRHVC